MFREPLTTDPKVARRISILLVASTLAMIPLAALPIILQDWFLLAVWVVVEADMVAMVAKHYAVGWPGSRLESFRTFPRARLSDAQRLLVAVALLTAMPVALVVFEGVRNELVLGIVGLLPAVALFRFVRAMQKGGWRGKKGGAR